MDQPRDDGIRTSMPIISFTKVALPYGWLGNMAPYPITLDGKEWRTSEALFQALRFAPDDEVREQIRSQKSPMAAKMTAKRNRSRMVVTPQSSDDLVNMLRVLHLKVNAHQSLVDQLLATGAALIIEDSTRRQNVSGLFWGAALQPDGSWKGENHLGQTWMALRKQLGGA